MVYVDGESYRQKKYGAPANSRRRTAPNTHPKHRRAKSRAQQTN